MESNALHKESDCIRQGFRRNPILKTRSKAAGKGDAEAGQNLNIRTLRKFAFGD
jgi:hypothetical protein